MTIEQIRVLRGVCEAILDAVRAGGAMGAPGGILYAALMASGCSFSQFQSLMGGLCRAGKLRKKGECYFINE